MAEVRLPTGRLINVPGVTSQEGVLMWLKANDPEEYTRTLNAYVGDEQAQPSTLAQVGRGIQDVATGVGQLTGTLPAIQQGLTYLPGGTAAGSLPQRTQEEAETAETEDIQQYESAVGPGIDWARIGGQAVGTSPLAFIPGSQAGLLGRAIGGGVAGGLGGASLFATEPNERMSNVILGGAGGALGGAVAPALTSLAGRGMQVAGRAGRGLGARLNPRMRTQIDLQLDEAGKRAGIPIESMDENVRAALQQEASRAMSAGGLDADALVRQAKLQQLGFQGPSAPIRSQVTRDPLQWGAERRLSQLQEGGEPLQARFGAQQQRARDVLEEQAGRYGEPVEAYEAGSVIREATERRADAWQEQIGELYDAAADVAPDVEMPTSSLRVAWDETLPDFEDVMPGAVQRRVTEILNPEAARRATPAEIRALDQMVNRRMRTTSDGERREALRQLKTGIEQTLDDFAESGAGGEAFTGAYRTAKREAWERASAIAPSKRIRLVDDILKDKVPPERLVENRIIGGTVDELRTLRDFVNDSGTEAWPKVQRSVMDWIYNKAVPREGGNVTPAGLRRAIRRIGDRKLSEILGPDGLTKLKQIQSGLDDLFVEPAPSGITSSPRSGTAQALAGYLRTALRAVAGGDAADAAIGAGRAGAQARVTARAISEALDPSARLPPIGTTVNPLARTLPYARGAGGAAGLPLIPMLDQPQRR